MSKLKTTNLDIYSGKTINMLPDRKYGGLRKRMGYEKLDHYPGRINCIYFDGTDLYVHAADLIYCNGDELMYAQDKRSKITVSGGVINISYDGPFTDATINDVTYFLDKGAIYSRQDLTYTTIYKRIVSIADEDLEDSFALTFDNYYIVFCPTNNAYALDLNTLKLYKLEHILARSACVINNRLYIGDISGNLYRFYNQITRHSSYSDNGRAIKAYLIIKHLPKSKLGRRKDYKNIDIILGCVHSYHIKIYGRGAFDKDNTFRLLAEKEMSFRHHFDFNQIDFGALNFFDRGYNLPCFARIFLGQVYSPEFKLEEDRLNKPFNIKSVEISFTEGERFY